MQDEEINGPDDDEKPEGEEPSGIESDEDVLKLVKTCKRESDKHLASWMKESKESYDLVAGHQWSEEDRAVLEEMNRRAVVFNRVGPVIDSVCGTEVNNRQQVQYIPRQAGDSGVNELLTGAAQWVRDNCDAEDEESDAFFDVCVCGMGWTETRMDYTDEQEGQVLIERIDPLSMRYDPAAKKRNLTDARWLQREEWMTKDEIEATWPESDELIEEQGLGTDEDNVTQPHDATNAWLYKKDAIAYDPKSGKFLVIHHQWFTLECYYRVADPSTGQVIEIDEERYEKIEEQTAKLGMELQSVKQTRKVYKQAFISGGTVLEKGLAPSQKGGFTFKCMTGKRDRNLNTWYGLVRSMSDPQRWANKFFSQILHIINSNAKGGLMVEDGATDNPRKLEADWAKADSIVTFNEGALSGGKVQNKPNPPYPVGPEKMMEFSIQSIRDAAGVNLEQLGQANRAQAGYLEAQRKESGMTILAGLFDSLRRYRKLQGRLLADFIKLYLSDGRLVRIVGGDGIERYIPLLRQDDTMQYDVIVDESPTSHNVKERVFGMMMQMMPTLAKMGLPVPPELIDYMPLPSGLTEKWKQQINAQKNNPQAQQMQQAQQQLDMAGRQANVRKLNADAVLKETQAQTTAQAFPGEQRQVNAEAQLKEMQAENEALALQLAHLQARLGIQAPEFQPQFSRMG